MAFLFNGVIFRFQPLIFRGFPPNIQGGQWQRALQLFHSFPPTVAVP